MDNQDNGKQNKNAKFFSMILQKSDCERISRYQFDSRKVQKNDLFFALNGEKNDGHDFLEAVAKQGAYGAVVSKTYKKESFGLKLFYVDDVLAALQALAKEKRKNMDVTVVGITGSCGKTTTKEYLSHLLKKRYKVYSNPESYNSQITLPITILNAPENIDIMILEISMSQKNEIDTLVAIASPHICVLTKVALAHVEKFSGGIKEIAQEKIKIFGSKEFKKGFFPYSFLPYCPQLNRLRDFASVSLDSKHADYYLSSDEKQMQVWENKKGFTYPKPFSEKHLLENFLMAGAVCRYFQMGWNEITSQITSIKPIAMRFEKFYQNGIMFINDAYNANPESMQMALAHMPTPMHEGKRIAVLGDMKELGDFSKKAHEEVFVKAKEQADLVLCMGEEFSCHFQNKKSKRAHFFTTHQALAKFLKKKMKKDDVILVKGSRSMAMEKIFPYL